MRDAQLVQRERSHSEVDGWTKSDSLGMEVPGRVQRQRICRPAAGTMPRKLGCLAEPPDTEQFLLSDRQL